MRSAIPQYRPRPIAITVLLGRNGVGKTTLLKALMGLVPPKTGTIEFDSQPIQNATPYQRARAGIGYVPQGREIFARLSVEDNLRMGLAGKAAGTPIPPDLYELFRSSNRCCTGAAATCRAASSSSWPLPVHWPPSPGC